MSWSMEKQIRGKSVLVTGGASGLGAMYAEAFLKEGARMVVIADIAVSQGNELAKKLNDAYGADRACFIKCDVSSDEELTKAFKLVLDKVGKLDVLVNNAGIMNDSPAVYKTANSVNWDGLVALSMMAFDHMSVEKGGSGGTIINISSIAALVIFETLPIYSGCKIAVLHFSQCMGMEHHYSRSKVRFLVICPGPTDTPLMCNLKSRCVDDFTGDMLQASLMTNQPQRPQVVVEGLIEMFKQGSSGSTWLSVRDRPVVDITPTLVEVFDKLTDLCK